MAISNARRYLKQQMYKYSYNKDSELYNVPLFFLNIMKTLVDTFKPYKSIQHRDRDIQHYADGWQKIKKGAVDFLIVVFMIVASAICASVAMSPFIGIPLAVILLAAGLYFAVQCEIAKERGDWGILSRVAGVIYGAGQVITSLRVSLRDYLSRDEELKDNYFQDRKSIRALLQKADDIIQTQSDNFGKEIDPVLQELRRKSRSCLAKQIDKQGSVGELSYSNKDPVNFLYKYFWDPKIQDIDDIKEELEVFRPSPI